MSDQVKNSEDRFSHNEAHLVDIGYPHDGRADKGRYRHDSRADKNPYRHDRRADSLSPYGQRHVILSPIDAHYKWSQNKIYSHVS